MKTRKRRELLKDSINLLRQVRSGMHSKSSSSLELKIEEVIAQLELVVRERRIDPERVNEALKALTQGLASLPAIVRIIDMIRNR
jgi:hypothetical protein